LIDNILDWLMHIILALLNVATIKHIRKLLAS
jgi:hypothetical protein